MAASRHHAAESSSSEDDEEMEKFREAAWSFGAAANGAQESHRTGGESKDKQSSRLHVSHHEHDANELQTTPEFRSHVAKKLGALLDSCISETTGPQLQKTLTTPYATRAEEDEDDGFRLFSTSVPGTTQSPPPSAPCHLIPSSSDSESELDERLKEAAVPLTDLLPAALLPSMPQPSCSPVPTPVGLQKKKKKKKKKKKMEEDRDEAGDKDTGGGNTKKSRKDMEEEDTGSLVDSVSQPSSEETPVREKKDKKREKEKVSSLKLSK